MNKFLTYFDKTKISNDSTQYVLRLFGISLWASIHSKNCSWFRILGIGIMRKHVCLLRFSERNGYKKRIRIGNFIFIYLHYR
jgi:hypothetical protein